MRVAGGKKKAVLEWLKPGFPIWISLEPRSGGVFHPLPRNAATRAVAVSTVALRRRTKFPSGLRSAMRMKQTGSVSPA